MRIVIPLTAILTCVPTLIFAQDNAQQRITQSIDAAERVCLVGKRYKFEADAFGAVTISKLLPGGEAKVIVDRVEAKGSQFFDNETIRREVENDIRECMKSQWPSILNAIGSPTPPNPMPSVVQFVDFDGPPLDTDPNTLLSSFPHGKWELTDSGSSVFRIKGKLLGENATIYYFPSADRSRVESVRFLVSSYYRSSNIRDPKGSQDSINNLRKNVSSALVSVLIRIYGNPAEKPATKTQDISDEKPFPLSNCNISERCDKTATRVTHEYHFRKENSVDLDESYEVVRSHVYFSNGTGYDMLEIEKLTLTIFP